METLRHWLEQPQPDRWHVIYAPETIADEQTVRKALTNANERIKLMPGLTKTLLSDIGKLPRVIADLIVAYEPPEFYEGFYCYSTTTNFWKVGDNSNLQIVRPSQEVSDPNIFAPNSIVVSRDLSECLNASVALSAGKSESAALVIIPQAKVIDMMAKANFSDLLALTSSSSAFEDPFLPISADRKSEYITRLLQSEVHAEWWSESMENGDLHRLLTCSVGQTTYNLTPAGKAAIRRFVETVIYSKIVVFFGNEEFSFGDFLLSIAPDTACHLVTGLLRHENRWIRTDAPPPLLRPSHAAMLVSPFFDRPTKEQPAPICTLDEKRLLFQRFLGYLQTCGNCRS